MVDFIANIVVGEKLGNGHFGEVLGLKMMLTAMLH